MTRTPVDRRAAIRALASGAAGVTASAAWVEALSAVARQHAHSAVAQGAMTAAEWKPRVLTPRQNDLVVALTEIIIPETDTPGAKAARVNRFVDGVLLEAPPAERRRFLDGLAWIDARSRALFTRDFLSASPANQTALVARLAAEDNPDGEARAGREFFQAIKAMTINGYYTTEIGMRQELGDNGQLFLPQFQGCDHPEHQR